MSSSRLHTAEDVILPERRSNEAGELRRVGVEIEFCGLELDEITSLVQECEGGKIEKKSDYEATVRDTSIGDIRVELDAALFRDLKIRGFFEDLKLHKIHPDLGGEIEEFMATEARRVVPFEVVFPPIPMDRLGELEALREALSRRAEGTHMSLFNAFGMHLNPELPALDAATILSYLRAFLVLYDELKDLHDVDPTRKVSPFIDPFPRKYVLKTLNLKYEPLMDQLIDDYIEANPTRNRPLDLLPVLAWVDEERVAARLPEEKISRRPALHYRLPNSMIDEADWSITREWNHWMRVEQLANDENKLRQAVRTRLMKIKHPIGYALRKFWRRLTG